MSNCLTQLQQILQGLPQAAYICSPTGDILFSNAQAVKLWGKVPPSGDASCRFLGPVEMLVDGSCVSPDESLVARARTEGRQSDTVYIRFRCGRAAKYALTAHPVEDGELVGVCCVLNEISDQVSAQPAGLDEQGFCESVIKTAAEGICVCFALDTFPYIRFTVWNERMTEITGYSLDEINQLGWYQSLYPDSDLRAKAIERMESMRLGNDLRNEEWSIVRKTGDERLVRISTSRLSIQEGDAVVALIQDVTEEASFKEALRDSERRLQLAIEAAQLGPWDWDLTTNQIVFTREWLKQLGYEVGEIEGSFECWESLLHPDDKAAILEKVQGYLSDQLPAYAAEFRLRHKDGTYRWIYTRGVKHYDASGRPVRMLGCHIDVTERRRAESTLEHILRSVTSTTGEEYFINLVNYLCESCDVDYAVIAELELSTAGRAQTIAVSYHGVPQDNFSYDLDGTPCGYMWERQAVCCFLGDVQTRYPHDEFLVEHGIISYMGLPLVSNTGQGLGALVLLSTKEWIDTESIASILQVTAARSTAELERRRAELAVRESERRLQLMAKTLPQTVYLFNVEMGQVEFHNQQIARDLGYSGSDSERFGSEFLHLLHPDDRVTLPQRISRWMTARDGDILETEYQLLDKRGNYRTFLSRDTVFERYPDGRVRLIIGTAQDMTPRLQAEQQRRQLEIQVQRAQKLESLGILAGGIAHDFNNLLTSILTYAELALESLPHNSITNEHVQCIIEGAQNAAELTRQMLAYTGKGSFELKPIDLSRVVLETSRLLQVSISKRCKLELFLPEDLPACQGDESQLRQVVMNLVINASEAIGDRAGQITVSVGVTCIVDTEHQRSCTGERVEVGEYIFLQVSDDGCGMDEATQQKLFDPFFTTKFSGRGLGMSTVLGIVRGHGGAIQVSSASDVGATIRVLLPIAESTLMKPVETEPAKAWEGKGTVLVADDETSVRNSLVILLKTLGYQVIPAADGAEAVEIFSARHDTIDVVLLDLTMPNLDGAQACAELNQLRPDIRVILMSGYNVEFSHEQLLDCGADAFLQKPFRIESLKKLLQQHCRPRE